MSLWSQITVDKLFAVDSQEEVPFGPERTCHVCHVSLLVLNISLLNTSVVI